MRPHRSRHRVSRRGPRCRRVERSIYPRGRIVYAAKAQQNSDTSESSDLDVGVSSANNTKRGVFPEPTAGSPLRIGAR